MSVRRRAPKRRVIDIRRVGEYPNVVWQHYLDCGHVEARKRKAPAERIGCPVCLDRQDSPAIVADTMRYAAEMQAEVEKAVERGLNKQFLFPSLIDVRVEVEDVDGQAQLKKASIEVKF